MEIHNVGRSGLLTSIVGLGCNNFGMRLDKGKSAEVVHAALDNGYTMFDTSDGYGNGVSEEYLGERPDLAASLREILTVDFSDATERVAELRAASTEIFNVLALTAAGAYYLDARVCDAISYPGQEPTPVSIDSFPDYVAEGLLDHMLA